jgi:uncharacterized protein
MDSSVLWSETIPGGGTWSHVLKRNTALRIVDTEGGANVGAYFLNFELPAERFNLPDTLKAQHTAKLTAGHVLMSDMGRILCAITEDSVGWHDPLSGASNAATVAKKYGEADYQEHQNSWHQNAFDGFLIELAKYGLDVRDFQAIVNLFSKVSVEADGSMRFIPGNSKAGDFIELRAEMNTLVILNTCQHPLDPDPKYNPKPVEITMKRVAKPSEQDICYRSRAENLRAHILTELYFL